MRRLAKHSREDVYATRRDYQQIIEHKTLLIKLPHPYSRIVLEKELTPSDASFVGFGGYLKPSRGCIARVSLIVDREVKREQQYELSSQWNRIGLAAPYDGEDQITVSIEFDGDVKRLHVWGFDCGVLKLPDKVSQNRMATLADLEALHICPETFYLPHQNVMNLEISADTSSAITIAEPSGTIELKKCSYCGRYLPLNGKRPGALAFHRHRAKVSGHQNECRACKKWRINNDFNPARTVDQLHESSVITRERKLLLREPEILQAIKDRHGAGLKSIVWEKFGRRCFNCETLLELAEVRLDHTRPLAYLWPIDEHATCLCEACNNHKKEQFPVDFYSDDQLHRLAEITGLSYNKLVKKDINGGMLKRITRGITDFSRTWEVRTFNATARKIKELRPRVDLFEILRKVDEESYNQVMAGLSERPGDEED